MSPTDADCQILIPFTDTFRSDYEPFVLPVLRDRERAPSDVSVFTARRALDAEDKSLFSDATVLFEEDLFTLDTYRQAKKAYQDLSCDIEDLCRDFDLSVDDRQATKRYFKKYCLDSVLFQSVLDQTDPDVLYAVQFTSNRGYLNAVRKRRDGEMLKTLVIQHGAFRHGIHHPFIGSDHALLWGEHFNSVLDSIDTAFQPPDTKVVGNPKLQARLAQYGRATEQSIGSPPTVLYTSTPVEHSLEAMRLFADVVNKYPNVKVIYRPHPSGEPAKYCSLRKDEFLREEQIERSQNVYSLINQSDVVVGTDTTALPEAVAFGVPVIQLLPERSGSKWAEGGICSVSTTEELDKMLSSLVTNPDERVAVLNRERPLAEQMFGDVSNASKIIAAYVDSFI
ncbi:hypothetical protein [Halobacterium bonnevillei]|uniref:Uncharacterized protein n=1 Tax=Halobacterium bonnevillei TaxID=2692200 RepID=A0A6B0SJL8_9EURY|nr:hypothetical protein [Halobacterium bonnevillei]MXR19072.1 hypothetical protein [Halobacterium bonnevillei]